MNTSPGAREKRAAALSSVAAAIILTVVKLVIGLMTNSMGILSEAAHSGLDLVAAVVTYFAVTISEKPPDREHHYGHGKIENLSALIETVLLVLTCVWILYEAISRLVANVTAIEVSYYSYGIMTLAIIVDIGRSRVLSRVAKKYNSQALAADALHFSSDIWTSMVVILGLFFVSRGYPVVDAVAAILVAFLVLFVSYKLGRETVDVLLDRVPTGLYDRIFGAVKATEGIQDVQNLRLRSSGSKVFVDTSVSIRRTMPFENSYAVVTAVENTIRAMHPDIDVIVHATPVETKDESLADKVRMIVSKKALRAPHNLEVHHIGGKYYIDFDIEFEKGKTFQEAHDLTSEIESEIQKVISPVKKITVHLEEFQSVPETLSLSTGDERLFRDAVLKSVLSDEDVLDCPEITLLGSGNSYNLYLTLGIGKGTSLAGVHKIVTRVESDLYREFSALNRVMIHAEPR